ncbi:MAG: TIGR00153 family protein [Verrucomicrobia bacterium]|nr:TIGR00153 family protein [Verrucomicrobiota bacterium]
MLTIARLFGKSPFAPLQTHMDKVASCIGKLPDLFKAILDQNETAIEQIGQKISQLEHEADLTKNDIRNHLPKSLFLPVDRGALLDILGLQDALSDQAEKIAQTAGFKTVEIPQSMTETFILYCQKVMEVFWLTRQVIKEIEELLESSFGGIEAEKVKGMVEQIAFLEYESSTLQVALLKKLFREGEMLSHPSFHLLNLLIEEIGALSHISEKLGNRIRMLLELK